MTWGGVQSLVLRPASGKAVVHLLLRVAAGQGGEALDLLRTVLRRLPPSFGEHEPADGIHCTVGFSYRGLQALGMPGGYLRVFSALAPAFAQGAPLRTAQLGDSGASAPAHWNPGFGLAQAHVLLTLHGERGQIVPLAATLQGLAPQGPLACVEVLEGERLGAPAGEVGEWVHFRLRDGLIDHHIVGVGSRRVARAAGKVPAPEPVAHAAGEFLLGHPNDQGFNPFNLPLAPAKVRRFFRDSSFGVLRPMLQQVDLFQRSVDAWQAQVQARLGQPVGPGFIQAKLCGRWPSGEAIRPGQLEVQRGDMELDFMRDPDGTGCPWFAHVRRMDPRGHRPTSNQRQRTLLRRGMPFGSANWDGAVDQVPRGLLGLFFCTNLEDQFEQLLGLWANGSPPGAPGGEVASDPIAGQHNGTRGVADFALKGGQQFRLAGFQPWTRTLGTVYTWHPDRTALHRLLHEDWLPEDEGGPWF